MNTTPLSWLIARRMGVAVWCYGATCRRGATYMDAETLAAKFDQNLTCEQASRSLTCSGCGARGTDGRVEMLPSTVDMTDITRGVAPGTTERAQVARMAEDREKDRARGWNPDEGRRQFR